MTIPFKCPECQGRAEVQLSEEETESMKKRILDEGRSPTIIIRCENNHELLVTLYRLRDGSGLGVRDVVVPVRSCEDDPGDEDDIDWLTKAFGGKK